MIKTLRFSLLSLLMIICGGVFAATETVDFTQLAITATDDGFTLASGNYTFTAVKNNGQTKPTQNGSAKDIRLYAKNTLTVSSTVPMTKMVFTISAQGKKRWADVTPSVGTVTNDVDNGQLVWTSDVAMASVDLTVGDDATVGTEAGKAGQFDFNSVEITTSEGGVVVEAPTFSLKGGIYTSEQLVTILAGAGCTIYYTTDGTVPTKESSVYSEPLYIGETTTLKAIAYDANGNASAVTTATYTLPVRCENIAAVKALEKGTLVALTLNDAQVVYVNSYKSGENTNTEYFVRDASGAIDLYNTGIELSANQIINGTLYVEYSPYNGLPELVKSDITDSKSITVTDGTEAMPTEVTVADLAGDKYLCDLVMVNNVHFTSEVSGNYTNYYILDTEGANKVMVYDKFKVGVEFPTNEDSKSYSVTGILGSASLSGKITNELFPIKIGDSVADGIADIEAATEAADTVVYNIAGQRLQKPQKGLNIINGKKVVIK